jgi:molybdopterin-guanine dinucleotide biosynthesis protein
LRQESDQGVLIGVCGIDGAGKTTLIAALREWAPLSEARVRKLKPGANYQRLMRGISDPWDLASSAATMITELLPSFVF